MTAARWDDLPADWSVSMQPTTATRYIPMVRALQASIVWRNLSRPQQELLLSCYADLPIKARSDVAARVVQRGLLDPDLGLTAAGREVCEWGRT